MRYFYDTEFIENGKTIDLISIGVVCEDGREFYRLNYDCDWTKASQWVKDNVLAQLSPKPQPKGFSSSKSFPEIAGWRNKKAIAKELLQFIEEGKEKPEFWAYYGDYDHVALCQLFGTMMDLPKGFPMYTRDLKQIIDELGSPHIAKQIEEIHKAIGNEHNALADALAIKDMYNFLKKNYKHPAFGNYQ